MSSFFRFSLQSMCITAAPSSPLDIPKPPGSPAADRTPGIVPPPDAGCRSNDLRTAYLQGIADRWQQRLPPADIVQLDDRYLVVRRRHCRARRPFLACEPPTAEPVPAVQLLLLQRTQQHGPGLLSASPTADAQAAWTAAQEQRYRRRLACVRLLVQSRLVLPQQPGAGEARFIAALAAATITSRTLRSLCKTTGPCL